MFYTNDVFLVSNVFMDLHLSPIYIPSFFVGHDNWCGIELKLFSKPLNYDDDYIMESWHVLKLEKFYFGCGQSLRSSSDSSK